MIGVILWSDSVAEKAVIWCEDHGDLAFLSRDACATLPDRFFDVGDMVEFDVFTENKIRKVQRASRLDQNIGRALADGLEASVPSAKARVEVADSAEIIPFRLSPAMRPVPAVQTQQRKRG